MPNDAKLGLVIGVGLVIVVAVVFFRKDLGTAKSTAEEPSSLAASPAPPPPTGYARALYRPIKAKTADRTEAGVTGRQHTVEKGETLFTLAQRYYGDKDKFIDIYRANREVVETPDELTPGTVLVIPELSD